MAELQVAGGYFGSRVATTGRMVAGGSVIALLLATFGIAGVVREATLRRTREIGLRMALGARPYRVVVTAARESSLSVLAGVALGLVLLFPLDRLLSGAMYDYMVQRLTQGLLDPAILGSAAILIAGTSCVAAVLAALRAARVDPMVALRSE
jgi:ABC-type antimicrobial peptide transport system permease subunit